MRKLEQRLDALETASGADHATVIIIRAIVDPALPPRQVVRYTAMRGAVAEWRREPGELLDAFEARVCSEAEVTHGPCALLREHYLGSDSAQP
jgi:hypothetical protein